MVHVEDLAFIHAQRLDAVLIGVGVDRLFEGLTQDVLAALGVGDQAVHGQHQVVGDQTVGGGEEAEVALDDAALVFGQAVCALPQGDVGGHVDLLRHPVVGTTVEVLLPGPFVLERHQLVEVGAGVDHLLVADLYAGCGAFQIVQTFLNVQLIQRGLGAGDGVGVVRADLTRVLHRTFGNVFHYRAVGERRARLGGCLGGGCGGGVFAVEIVPAEHGVSPFGRQPQALSCKRQVVWCGGGEWCEPWTRRGAWFFSGFPPSRE